MRIEKLMEIINWDNISDFSSLFKNGTALTVGSFDGPHRGHDVLFENVLVAAKEKKLVPGVVTFRRSAAVFRAAKSYPGDIATLSQRLSVFENRGMSFAIVIDFSGDFAKIEGEKFMSILFSDCKMRFMSEGIDFRCGFRGATGRAEIERFAQVNKIDWKFADHVFDDGKRISSSRIRECISQKKFDEAARLLGRNFSIDANAFSWNIESDALCAKRSECLQVLPPEGCYIVNAKSAGVGVKAKFFVEEQTLKILFEQKKIDKLESIEFCD